MAFCSKCGAQVNDNEKFCASCGAPLGAPESAQNTTGAAGNANSFNNTQNQAPFTPQRPPVSQKNIAVCIILSIITCGIYGLYWLYTLTEDLNTLYGDPTATSGGMVIVFSLLTCNIYQLYWLFKQGDRIDQIKTARGLPSGNSGILYLVLSLFGFSIVSWALMQSEINKLV